MWDLFFSIFSRLGVSTRCQDLVVFSRLGVSARCEDLAKIEASYHIENMVFISSVSPGCIQLDDKRVQINLYDYKICGRTFRKSRAGYISSHQK